MNVQAAEYLIRSLIKMAKGNSVELDVSIFERGNRVLEVSVRDAHAEATTSFSEKSSEKSA